MTELLTAAQMKAVEQAAIDSGQVTGLELMERAGRGVVEAVFEEWPELAKTSHRAVVLCGPGNNGGDGFVVARLLKDWGWEVEVFLYGDADKLPPDARVNFERLGGGVLPLTDYARKEGWQCDLLVDALFGTGLKRSLRDLGELFWNMEDMCDCFPIEFGHKRGRPAIVAIDIVSGVCADSGREFPHEDDYNRFSAAAHLTVSFHKEKQGHFLADGPRQCGKVVTKNIGITETKKWKRENQTSICKMLSSLHKSWICKDVEDHKFSYGHAIILSGPSGKSGAARLAARGALRIGAGVVTVGCPPDALAENAAQLNAIMLEAVYDAEALARILQDTRINALCLGPALGKGAREQALVLAALETKRPLVLDADALSFGFFDEADALFGKLHDKVVLTPHAGEFARLFPDIAEKLNAPAVSGPAYSKVDATREAAKRAGCVVLFKGADTVIAAPDGRAALNSAQYERAAPWLATAGSGDVLAGFITGLLARGFAPMQAAETAAWLHVECARAFGAGLIAEDLPDLLPAILRQLGC